MDTVRSDHRRLGAGAAAVAAIAALAGCSAVAPLAEQVRAGAHELAQASHLTPLGVDPSSPIAADALKAEQVDAPIPSLASIPPKPGDVRGPAAYKAEVVTLVSTKRGLNQWADANPPGVPDTAASDRYADAQRARVGHEAPVGSGKSSETEAFAHKGRTAVGQADAATPARSPN